MNGRLESSGGEFFMSSLFPRGSQRICCAGQFTVPWWQTTSWLGWSPGVQTAVHVFLSAVSTAYMCFQLVECPGWDVQEAFCVGRFTLGPAKKLAKNTTNTIYYIDYNNSRLFLYSFESHSFLVKYFLFGRVLKLLPLSFMIHKQQNFWVLCVAC